MNNIGIGGILTFNPTNSVAGMNGVARAANNLAGSQRGIGSWANSVSAGMNSMGQGAARAGFALAPLTAGFILGGREAAKFEQQMDVVRGVSGATEQTMAKLGTSAKNLGLDFIFDPTTVGKGMEELARAGFSANETLQAVRGTMAAAAADGMELKDATEIVSNVIRGMGLEAKDAGRVSDVLALASAKTTTDIKSLGFAMKYAAAQAHTMKIPLEETVSMLALASDAALKGTSGGTSFANTLRALAKPNKMAQKWMKANNIQMSKTAEGGLDVINVFKQIHGALEKEGDVMKKSAALTSLFGRYGEKAFSAISKGMTALDEKGRPKIDSLTEALYNAQGAAARIAEARLDNFLGQITRLGNIMKTGAIELWGAALKSSTEYLKVFADYSREIVRSIIMLNEGVKASDIIGTLGDPRLLAAAQGIRDGFMMIFQTADRLIGKIMDISGAIADKMGPQGIYILTKWGVLLLGIAALAGPILLGFGAMLLVLAPIVSAIGAIGSALVAVAGAVPYILLAFGSIGMAIDLVSLKGEKWYETIIRMAYGAYAAAMYLHDEALVPLGRVFDAFLLPALMKYWGYVKAFGAAFKHIFQNAVGSVIIVIKTLMPVFKTVLSVMIGALGMFWKVGAAVFAGFAGGVIIQFVAILTAWKIMITGILVTLQMIGKVALAAAEVTGQAKTNGKFWADVAFFVSQDPAAILKGGSDPGGPQAAVNGIGAGWEGIKESFMGALDGREDEAASSPVSGIMASQKILQDKAKADAERGITLEDKRKLDINNCVTVDGRNLAIAQGRHQQEIHERAGFRATPWQRRATLEQGATPVGGMGGGL